MQKDKNNVFNQKTNLNEILLKELLYEKFF